MTQTQQTAPNTAEVSPSSNGFVMRDKELEIRRATKALNKYWRTYNKQQGYTEYSPNTFIDDALYGIGIAIDKERFECADGYDKFKTALREHLGMNKQTELLALLKDIKEWDLANTQGEMIETGEVKFTIPIELRKRIKEALGA